MFTHDETCNAFDGEACTCKRTKGLIGWESHEEAAPNVAVEDGKPHRGVWRVSVKSYSRLGENLS